MDVLELPQMTLNKTALQSLEQRAGSIIDQAPMVLAAIHDVATAQAAVEWVTATQAFIADVNAGELGVAKRVFHKAHDGICKLIGRFTKPCEDWVEKINRRIVNVKLEEERRRAEESRLAAEAARKLAEEQKLVVAVQLEGMGQQKMADAVLASPTHIVAPPPAEVEIAGKSFRKKWKARVADKVAFVKMAAERHDFLAYIHIDEVELGKLITKLEGNANIAGIEHWREDVAANSSRRSA